MSDEHRYTLVVVDEYVTLEVVCPYRPSDESRPCWPHGEDGEPDPAPRLDCTYESWVDGIGRDVLHGEWRFDLPAEWEWSAWDGPRLRPVPEPSEGESA